MEFCHARGSASGAAQFRGKDRGFSGRQVIGAAKVSHFEINCRVLKIVPTLNLFHVFYIPSFNSGWMSFSKRPGKNTPQCYTKPLDSLKNWNNRFFWVDERVLPTIADWRTSAPKDKMPADDTYTLEAVTVLNTHHTPIQKQPEALLCLVWLSRRYFLGDDVYPTLLHDDDRGGTEDQGQETVAPEVPPPENVTTTGVTPEAGLVEEIAAMGPRVIKERRKRGNDGVDTNAPPKVLRKDHADSQLMHSTVGGKSLTSMGLGTGSTFPAATSSSKGSAIVGDLESENTSFTSMVGSPESIYQPEWGVTNGCCLDAPEACQDLVDHIAPPGYFSELRHFHNDDFLKQYNINLARQVAIGSQLRLRFEQEAKLLKKSVAQVSRRDQRIQARENEIKKLEALLEAETDMKKATESKNAEFGKELKNLRALFSDLQVSNDRLSQQGMSEGLKYGVEHGKANLDLEAIEAYDPNADTKYVVALHALRDLKHLMVDQLKSLKDASIDVIMTSLHLESDTGEDAPQWIHELRPSSSQLKIPVYPKVRDPRDPWSFKEEILLVDAIAANVSRAEKKKRCRVVFRTYGVGSAHHARSDGVPVSVPIVAPQGLSILLADAATQTKTSEDGASPAMYNLD
nr:hypothetical protein [Tanacetum cinerariifolium]